VAHPNHETSEITECTHQGRKLFRTQWKVITWCKIQLRRGSERITSYALERTNYVRESQSNTEHPRRYESPSLGSILVGLELQLDAHLLLQAASTCPRDAHASHRTCWPAALEAAAAALSVLLLQPGSRAPLHTSLCTGLPSHRETEVIGGGGWPEGKAGDSIWIESAVRTIMEGPGLGIRSGRPEEEVTAGGRPPVEGGHAM
jgi:hypothetical protein